MKKTLQLFLLVFITSSLFAQNSSDIPFVDLPPTNEFGKCYAKCKIANQYETVSRQVLVKEASTKLQRQAAVYSDQSQTVLVKDASVTYRVTEPKYRTATETIVTRPEGRRIRTVPAKYRTESRQVLVTPARGEWVKKKKSPNCFSKNPEDCYVACYEEVPAKYRTETYKVLAEGARTTEEVIPAKTTTVSKRVLVEPGRAIEVPIEAKYKTITTKVLVSPEATTEVVVPAVYKTVNEKVLVREGGYTVWTEILCASQTSSKTVRDVQSALKAAGYNPGPIDGVMGLQTQTALTQFQTDKGLPIGNMNIETLGALQIKH